MSFETQGTVHKIFDAENKSETFRTREFVIKQEGNYPQFIKFQLTQDRCDIVSNYNEGDQVKVSFDLRGREWNEKYFTNLNAWKIDKVSADNNGQPSGPPPNQEFTPMAEPVSNSGGNGNLTAEDFDDLPF